MKNIVNSLLAFFQPGFQACTFNKYLEARSKMGMAYHSGRYWHRRRDADAHRRFRRRDADAHRRFRRHDADAHRRFRGRYCCALLANEERTQKKKTASNLCVSYPAVNLKL